MAFMNDRCSVFLVLGLAGESELVLRLAVRDLVNAAVGVGGSEREKFDEGVLVLKRKLRTGTTRS